MQTLYVTEAVMLYRKNYLNTTSLKTILSIFYSLNSSSVSVISIKNRVARKGQPRSCRKIYWLVQSGQRENPSSVYYGKSRRYVQRYKGCKMSDWYFWQQYLQDSYRKRKYTAVCGKRFVHHFAWYLCWYYVRCRTNSYQLWKLRSAYDYKSLKCFSDLRTLNLQERTFIQG